MIKILRQAIAQRQHLLMGLGILLIVLKLTAVVVTVPGVSAHTFSAIVMALMGLVIITGKEIHINFTLGAFCIVALESLMLNHPPGQLQGGEHLAYFILMLTLLSPLINNSDMHMWRRWMWRALIWGLRCIVSVSAIMYIPFEINHPPVKAIFGGCVCMGMLLGIIAAIVSIDSAWQLFRCHRRRYIYIVHCLLFIASLILTVASGSRCAILASIGGLIVVAWWQRSNRHMWIGLAATAVVITVALTFSGMHTTEAVGYKFSLAQEHGSISYSRDRLWAMRFDEFKSSPIIGIGFATSFVEQGKYVTKHSDKRIERLREPGSSWLTVLSNVGLLGFGLFVAFNVGLIRRLKRRISQGDTYARLLLALTIALWIHGCFEGWVLYAGSITFVIYWLLTSQIYDHD